jgi:hypothetical protein
MSTMTAPAEVRDPGAHVGRGTITYETTQGSFTVSGKTIPEAVDAAFANPDAW